MERENPTSDSFVLVAFFFEAGLGAVAIGVGWLIGFDPLTTLPLKIEALPGMLQDAGWGVVAAVPLFLGLLLIDRIQIGPFVRLRELVETRLLGLFAPLSLFELAAVSIAAGFGEETLFRGLLQAALADSIGPPNGIVWAVALAGLLFGLCHWLTPTYAVFAALVGVYLGILFALTGSLLAPLVAHGLYDFAALVYMTRRWPRDS